MKAWQGNVSSTSAVQKKVTVKSYQKSPDRVSRLARVPGGDTVSVS